MQPSGNWKLGLTYSLLTALLWGVLPLALTALLVQLDPYTITWVRFSVAAILLGFFLRRQRRLPKPQTLGQGTLWLLLATSLALVGNYVLYLIGLDLTNPESAQLLNQVSSVFLLLGGVWVFQENLRAVQWWGVVVFLGGLILFFHRRLETFFQSDPNYYIGLVILVAASLSWALYGMGQKRLLDWWRSDQILLCVYVIAAVVLAPFSHISHLVGLDTGQWGLLLFAALNTLIAYGAFAEALAHWEASRVSAVLAVTPLFTFLSVRVAEYWKPGYFPREELDLLSVVGAFAVVAGSILTALARRRVEPVSPPE
ncbi:MAG TPA: DMT family transporter [Acidobacteriota bacterium]|nr:DMT family transporter [Acidobacteriota bacterium]